MAIWKKTIGRVAFINCDPLFFGLDESWNVLSSPPSWLTKHVLNKDCVIAPIPTAGYAMNHEELVLIPDIGICSNGEVGSVIVFGEKEITDMSSIAMPSDSSSSVNLLRWWLKENGLSPVEVTMGPHLENMLDRCDGALLIGDRALQSARDNTELVKLDLGKAWQDSTGKPMVFGVFVARKDTPVSDLKRAHKALLKQLELFESNSDVKQHVVQNASANSNLSNQRLSDYFNEVFNRLDNAHVEGLEHYLRLVFGIESIEFAW